MSDYAALEKRLADREVILLDGAIGTQLQAMDVPMADFAWAALALHGHPYTVRRSRRRSRAAFAHVLLVNHFVAAIAALFVDRAGVAVVDQHPQTYPGEAALGQIVLGGVEQGAADPKAAMGAKYDP